MSGRTGTLYQTLPQAATSVERDFDTQEALQSGSVDYVLFDGQTLPAGTPAMTTTGGVLALSIPYVQVGNWTSPPIPLAAVQWFLNGAVPNQQAVPAGTACSVFISLDNGATWTAVPAGFGGLYTLRGILIQGESVSGDTARIMVTMTTASQSKTPQLSGLHINMSGIGLSAQWLSGMAARLRAHLYSPVNADPMPAKVFRLAYDGGLSWTISDLQLTAAVTGGSSRSITLLLPMCTIGDLQNIFSQAPGYQVLEYDVSASDLGAVALLEGSGDLNQLNGGALYRATNPLWDIVQAWEWELEQLRAMVPEALAQMDIRTANAPWLDTWGGCFGVVRDRGEADAGYARRVETQPFALRCNNLAMEQRVEDATGLKVQCVTLRWKPDESRFMRRNARPIYRQGVPVYPVRNDPRWLRGPSDPDNPYLAFLSSLGIPLVNGVPYWGDPDNGNPLVCAFAVLLGFDLSAALQQSVAAVIEANQAGGTLALYFQPSALIRRNTPGNPRNGTLERGPTASAYAQVQL